VAKEEELLDAFHTTNGDGLTLEERETIDKLVRESEEADEFDIF